MIRPSALGDVVRSVPVLVSLRDAYPRARIDWLVQDSFVDAVRVHPALNGVVPFPRQQFAAWTRGLRWGRVRAFLRALREPRYDLVLDCQGLARSALFAWATRAPLRVGYADARELGWAALTRRVGVSIEQHTVERMLALVEALGIPARRDAAAQRLEAGEPARAWAAERLGPRRCVVLAPTSRWPGKQWPADRFADTARRLTDAGLAVALVGGGNERAQVAPLLDLAARNPNVVDLLGSTTIARLIAVIERSALTIANDSAALHIAVALARPIVGLYGPTRVHRVGPYRRERDVIQHAGPDDRLDHKDERRGRELMERIGADEVWRAVESRLRAPGVTANPT